MEEFWTIEWLSSMDATGATPHRELEVARTIMKYDFLVGVPFRNCYMLSNLAAGACGYLASELKECKWNYLVDEATLPMVQATFISAEQDALLEQVCFSLQKQGSPYAYGKATFSFPLIPCAAIGGNQ